MRAFRLITEQCTELVTIPQRELGPGEVLVKVGAAGGGDSDLHIVEAPQGSGFPVPLTPEHENAGWVQALGLGMARWEKGEAVAVYGIVGRSLPAAQPR